MNIETALICQESLDLLSGQEDAFVNALYLEVFDRVPEIRDLFGADIDEFPVRQATVLRMGMVLMDHPESLGPKLRELGRTHEGYGVKPHHYEIVERALIDVLAWYVGEDKWSERFANAWRELIGFVAMEMTAGAAERAA